MSEKKNQKSLFKSKDSESEGLTIKIELDEHVQSEGNQPFANSTKVKYCINFSEASRDRGFNFDAIENKAQKSNQSCLPRQCSNLSSSKKEIMNCKGVSGGLSKELDGKLYNLCATGEF